jgi:hypothetical protein
VGHSSIADAGAYTRAVGTRRLLCLPSRDAVAGRLEAVQGRRPADDELLITSGGIEEQHTDQL